MNLRKQWAVVIVGIMALAPITFAKGRAKKEEDRIADSGLVMKEILSGAR